MKDGIFHGVAVDEEGKLGYGRLWFYYAVDYTVSSGVGFGGRLAGTAIAYEVKMGRIKVTSIGWEDDDVHDEDLDRADKDAMARLVLSLVKADWARIAETIMESREGGGE